ncbi:hypothetical protein [Aquimarina sp. RZ0]|uniref:hypothetical protein n=1 Tax=Aquimarina sp. RZ0 TaxID=2607730 RepID=UPI0011F0B148|nr:hypothetical protein [Aquimarina sp. RZ0]KAA1241005.1 hypothetical protein F0000_26805 [Aquimarina sp. RZ0]
MKKTFIISLLLILNFISSCKRDQNKVQKVPEKEIKAEPKEENYVIKSYRNQEVVDTILEKNNPKNLDLLRHQLFRDTTRNSEFYAKYFNRRQIKFENDAISYYINEISKKHKLKKIKLGDFPKQWISLKKINNEFVIYDPCDGNTTYYEIRDNSVIFHYQLEPDADAIDNLIMLNKNGLELELWTISQKTRSEKSKLTITPTEFTNVYLLTYTFDDVINKQFVTPKNKIAEFDLIVNHCPISKVSEYRGFDK